MSIVIIGGNERMHRIYEEACKEYGCKVKIFTKPKSDLRKQVGSPDLFILFTNTVCHKMVISAVSEAKRCSAQIARSHSSSISALNNILESYC